MSYDAIVVGAGFAGSVVAERMASQCGMEVLVVERREHVAGNAYDEHMAVAGPLRGVDEADDDLDGTHWSSLEGRCRVTLPRRSMKSCVTTNPFDWCSSMPIDTSPYGALFGAIFVR